MARPRKRSWLDVGFRLDINALLRAGLKNGTHKVVAYRTQFLSPYNRAHFGIRRIEARLGKKPDDDALYRPKWQRTATFDRYCEKIDRYENVLDTQLLRSLGRIIAMTK